MRTKGGVIQSKHVNGQDVYKYGFIEIYAKLPTSYFSLWPGFWLWSASCPTTPYYDEIDATENGAVDSYDGYKFGTNFHINVSNINCQMVNTDQVLDIPTPLLSAAFHKFAVEWTPDRVIWYFDDVAVRMQYDASGTTIPQHKMAVILNFCVDPWSAFLPSDWNNISNLGHTPTSWATAPQYFEIDYLHYYKLTADCNTNLTICSPSTDYSARAVKKTITTGGSCSPTFDTSDEYTLRATDYVVLDAGTTINSNGSGFFAIDIMACPQ
jgi:beta-glucanase (GH16 family)